MYEHFRQMDSVQVFSHSGIGEKKYLLGKKRVDYFLYTFIRAYKTLFTWSWAYLLDVVRYAMVTCVLYCVTHIWWMLLIVYWIEDTKIESFNHDYIWLWCLAFTISYDIVI